VQQVQQLADIMTEVQYDAGETVIKQGSTGDSFYVIRSGTCIKTSKKVMRNSQETLGENHFFGEGALLSQEARSYSVVAAQKIKLVTVDRGTFESKIGNMSKMISEDKKRRDERSFALSGAGPPLKTISKHGAIVVDDSHMTVSCEAGGKFGSLKIVYKAEVVKLHQEENVMREVRVARDPAGGPDVFCRENHYFHLTPTPLHHPRRRWIFSRVCRSRQSLPTALAYRL
jgi:hypothetical protein